MRGQGSLARYATLQNLQKHNQNRNNRIQTHLFQKNPALKRNNCLKMVNFRKIRGSSAFALLRNFVKSSKKQELSKLLTSN